MNKITESIMQIEEIKKIIQSSPKAKKILGLNAISKACITNAIYEETKKNILIITYNEIVAEELYKTIKEVEENVTYIPKKEIITYSYDAQNMDTLYTRIEGIIKLAEEKENITIISAETALTKILTKKTLQNSILKVMVANEYNLEEIKEKLISLGYERQDLVEGKGTFSLRGDILDIGITSKKGIRIEFFGDEVDRIEYFDISTQRGIENINQIKIYPLTEEIDKEPKANILDYLQPSSIVILDEISKIKARAKSILEDNKLLIKDLIEKQKEVPYILENMAKIEELEEKIKEYQTIYLESDDISSEKNVVTINHNQIKKIEEEYLKQTKQEKETKREKIKKRRTPEFREAEKISFSDLKVRRLYCS